MNTITQSLSQWCILVHKLKSVGPFITDENSAIQWLQREFDLETSAGPQICQDLQPKFFYHHRVVEQRIGAGVAIVNLLFSN